MRLYRKKLNIFAKVFLVLIGTVLLTTCSNEKILEDTQGTTVWKSAKVAIVVPLSGDDNGRDQYERICQFFEEKTMLAQYSWDDGIRLELEWYDENTEDLRELARKIKERSDLKAIIGPIKDENIEKMADILRNGPTPMFVMSPSEEILRKYSCKEAGLSRNEPFLWSLCESDITQAQLMIYKIASTGKKKVSVISADNSYGNTYHKWIPYHANETRQEMVDNMQYSDLSELESAMERLMCSNTDYIICALNSTEEVRVVLETAKKKPQGPKLLFSGSIFKGDVMSLGDLTEGMEGLSLYSSPNTGFHLAYKERFGTQPRPFESQFYDALLLSFVAANICHYINTEMTMNEAVKSISELSLTEEDDLPISYEWGKGTPIWDYYYLKSSVLTPIRFGRMPELNLLGASGNLKFAAETYTSLVQSTYAHWIIYNGQPLVLEFVAAEGSRVSNYQASWIVKNQNMDDIEDVDSNIEYPELKDKWAVLICGSKEWNNYRHQADLLNFYQFLKKKGMKDDRIILIMQDDIARNEHNPYPNVIRSSLYGENLYQDIELDYKAGDISVEDISDIMLGRESKRLPTVLKSGECDNVLIYWTGHGNRGSFQWLDEEVFTIERLKRVLTKMQTEKRYRQMLLLAEPCFSGSVVKAVEGITGILGIASADEHESSFADEFNSDLMVWMCDRFTKNLVYTLYENPCITFKNLYENLNASTMGSHVRIYNQKLFNNLHYSSPELFYWNDIPLISN